MGFYNLELDELSEYTGLSVADLKSKKYDELEKMIADMKSDKILKRNNVNDKDKAYRAMVMKYFQPVAFLRHWFTEDEIVHACAMAGVTDRDICQELPIEPGKKCWVQNSEFLRNSVEAVPQYDKMGRELMERAYKRMDVYRIANNYQGLHHGDVVLYLLYDRYPELMPFNFQAYSMDYGRGANYEIYPDNHVYVPLAALMNGDVDMIMHRNREYCKWYNNGRYSPAECEKAFRSDEVKEMFRIIKSIGEREREAGNNIVSSDMHNPVATADNMSMSETSENNGMSIFRENVPKEYLKNDPCRHRNMRVIMNKLYDLGSFVKEFINVIGPNVGTCVLHIAKNDDVSCEDAFTVELGHDRNTNYVIDENTFMHDGVDMSDRMVVSNFGWQCYANYEITIRIGDAKESKN